MKRIITTVAASLLAIGLLAATGTSQAGATHRPKERPTIAGIVARSGGEFDRNRHDYDILLNAVSAAGLVDTLNTPGLDVTVWAPNDAAFVRLAQDLGVEGNDERVAFEAIVATLTALGGGDPLPLLTSILTYHVTPGARGVWNVLFTHEFPTLQGATIGRNFRSWTSILDLVDKEPGLEDPALTFPIGVRASNGVIHTIDRVLIPVDLDAVPNP
ncbi:MAG TPA: fasciclin domain-containing protein [Microthrixaceae bacterium]|nr:fasciclin domain-containing protein [Microthrixaceae bacterium]